MTETHRIGITGAAGYIGSCVATTLLDAGNEIVPVDDFSHAKVDDIDGSAIHEVDVRDRAALRDVFADVDAVAHLAAISGVQECDAAPEAAFDVNVRGTENVAWLCRERGLPLVFPASMGIIGDPVSFPIDAAHPRDPLNHYSRTKAMSEEDIHWLADGAFPAHVLMKSNLYGHHRVGGRDVAKHTVINLFVDMALDGGPLTVHEPGTQSRDFIHVEDVARAYRCSLDALVDAGPGAATIPIASGDCRSVLEIAETVQRIVDEERGYRPEIELVENPRSAETTTGDFTVDTGRARVLIGFEAERTVERTIREMVS